MVRGLDKKRKGGIGSLFFVVGAIVAILGGLIYPGGLNLALSSVLIVFGIVVGFLNITTKETTSFLLATVSLVVMTALGGAVLAQVATIGIYLEGILLSILIFVVPAGIIVALRVVYTLEKD